MSSKLFDPPLNGLVVKRKTEGGVEEEGTVVASNIRGRPTAEVPKVPSEYTVQWSDGRIEGGLTCQAVLGFEQVRWTSQAWKDAYFESNLGGGGARLSFEPMTSGSGLLHSLRMGSENLAVIAPPRSEPPKGSYNFTPTPMIQSGRSGYTIQDKSRIADMFRPPQPPSTVAGKLNMAEGTTSPSPKSAAKSSANPSTGKEKGKNGSSAKTKAKGTGKGKKRKASSDSEPEDEVEEEEAAVDEEEAKEELEEPEFMRRTYPREVAFKEGDVPLEEYAGKPPPDDAEFTVEAIVDEVTIGNKKFVLVKWLGYELDTKDWSPAADVKHTTPYLDWVKKKKEEAKASKSAKKK